MRSGTAFTWLSLALSLQGVVATGWRDASSFSCPSNTDNQCTDNESGGWDFGDAPTGSLPSYKNYDLNGWSCKDVGSGKRDVFARTGGSKCIAGTASKNTASNSISCGSGSGSSKNFSVGQMHVSTDNDNTPLEFHYQMPGGSTCKQTSTCGKDVSAVSNDQCGGATAVQVKVAPTHTKESCSVSIHSVSFNCNTKTTSVPVPTTTLPTTTASTPVASTPVSSSEVSSTPVASTQSTPVASTPSSTPVQTTPVATTPSTTPVSSATESCTLPAECSGTMAATGSCTMAPGCSTPVASTESTPVASTSVASTPVSSTVESTPVSSATSSCTLPAECSGSFGSGSCTMPAGCTSLASTPVASTPVASTPVESSASSTPVSSTESTPVASTPVESSASSTPVASTPVASTESTPVASTPVGSSVASTPVASTPATTPVASTPVGTASTPVGTAPSSCTLPAECNGSYGSGASCTMPAGCTTLAATSSVVPPAFGNSTVPAGATTTPAAGTGSSGSGSTSGSSVSVSSAPQPSVSMPATTCPDVLPRCLKTWIFTTSCTDTADANCWCGNSDFVTKVSGCLSSWGESDSQVASAVEYFMGLCHPYIPSNPAIVSAIPASITLPSVPSGVPTTTIVRTVTTVVPCSPTTLSEGSSSGSVVSFTTSTATNTVTIPQVTLVVTSTEANLVYPTPAPSAGAPATTAPEVSAIATAAPGTPAGPTTLLTSAAGATPIAGGSYGNGTSNGTLATQPSTPVQATGAGSALSPAGVVTFVGVVAVALFQL